MLETDAIPVLPANGSIDVAAAAQSDLLLVHPTGTRPPLYLVRIWHEAELESFRAIARSLGEDQPICLVGPPSEARRMDSRPSVESWVDHVLAQLEKSPTSGPIQIGGWSFGGVIALEVARRLADAGRKVRLVLMIDTWLPVKHAKKPRSFPRKLVELYESVRARQPGDRWRVLRDPILWRVAKLRRAGIRAALRLGFEIADSSAAEDPEKFVDPLRRAVWVAYLKYDARPTTLAVALLWCEDSRQKVGESTLGWSPWLRGPLECSPAPGKHFSTLGHAPQLARLIDASLNTAARR